MIQYKLQLLAGGFDCSVTGSKLEIGLDGGRPSFRIGTKYQNIGTIEVYVSGADDSQFRIVGIERTADNTDVSAPQEEWTPATDPGSYIGSSTTANPRSVQLDFSAPANNDSKHAWVFGQGTPSLKLTVKVKRQQSPNTGPCSSWPAILPA